MSISIKQLINRLKYPRKRSALKYFFEDPLLTFAIFPDTSKFYLSRTLENVLDSDMVSGLHYFLPERFFNHLTERSFKDTQGTNLLLYLICRKYKPEIVVETGVAHGRSTSFILAAMHENKKGHLYSIDLPPYDTSVKVEDEGLEHVHVLADGQKHRITKKYSAGDLVPSYLKDRWTLIPGDAKEELPILLKKLKRVSIFFHDSLHTEEHMMFEYDTSWPYIEKKGLLLSHDVLWNDAFSRFSKKVNREPSIFYTFGIIKKS